MEPHDEIIGALFSEDPVHDPLGYSEPRPRVTFRRIEALARVVKCPGRYGLRELLKG